MKFPYIFLVLIMAVPLTAHTAQAANESQVNQLISTKKCNGCDLTGADLIGADLTGAQLQGANLNAANLTGANLTGANLTKASAAGASFMGANLQNAVLTEASMVYANLAKAKLSGATLNITDLQAANLAEADLTSAKISKTDFVGANLYKAKTPATINSNGNMFKGGIRVGLASGSNTVERASGDPSLESGGGRVIRRYSIPAWVGRSQRSTAGTARYYNPQDPAITLELW
jgi:Pentapeptide repeats (8 copies)